MKGTHSAPSVCMGSRWYRSGVIRQLRWAETIVPRGPEAKSHVSLFISLLFPPLSNHVKARYAPQVLNVQSELSTPEPWQDSGR